MENFLFSLASTAQAQGPANTYPTGPGMMGWGYGMGSFGWLFMILFWVLVIAGIVFLVRSLSGNKGGGDQGSETAIDILKKRYARGEITKEEYEKMKKDISE